MAFVGLINLVKWFVNSTALSGLTVLTAWIEQMLCRHSFKLHQFLLRCFLITVVLFGPEVTLLSDMKVIWRKISIKL